MIIKILNPKTFAIPPQLFESPTHSIHVQSTSSKEFGHNYKLIWLLSF